MIIINYYFQGTSVAKCHIFLWRHTDKLVISDIDGTITKSDVLGHILPVIGNNILSPVRAWIIWFEPQAKTGPSQVWQICSVRFTRMDTRSCIWVRGLLDNPQSPKNISNLSNRVTSRFLMVLSSSTLTLWSMHSRGRWLIGIQKSSRFDVWKTFSLCFVDVRQTRSLLATETVPMTPLHTEPLVFQSQEYSPSIQLGNWNMSSHKISLLRKFSDIICFNILILALVIGILSKILWWI